MVEVLPVASVIDKYSPGLPVPGKSPSELHRKSSWVLVTSAKVSRGSVSKSKVADPALAAVNATVETTAATHFQ